MLGFPTGQKFLVPRDKGTDMLLLSRDKGTAGQENLFCPGTKGQRDKLKILPRDGTGRDFLRLSRPVPGRPAGQNGRLFFTFLLSSGQKGFQKGIQNDLPTDQK